MRGYLLSEEVRIRDVAVEVAAQRLLHHLVDCGGDLLALVGEERQHRALRGCVGTSEEGVDVGLERLVVLLGEARVHVSVHCRTGGRLGASGRVRSEACEFGAGRTQGGAGAVAEGDHRLQHVEVVLRVAHALREQLDARASKELRQLGCDAIHARQLAEVVHVEGVELEDPLAVEGAVARAWCLGRAGALAPATVSSIARRRWWHLEAHGGHLGLQLTNLLYLLGRALCHGLLNHLRHFGNVDVGEPHVRESGGPAIKVRAGASVAWRWWPSPALRGEAGRARRHWWGGERGWPGRSWAGVHTARPGWTSP